MENITKKVTKVGNSCGVVIDGIMSYITGIKLGDEVQIKCNKNKITITKNKEN